MADIEDDGFTEAAFAMLDPKAEPTPPVVNDPVTPPVADPVTPPVTPPTEPPVVEPPKPVEDPKPGETPPAADPKPGEDPKPPEVPGEGDPKPPEEPVVPEPVTKDDVTSIISKLRNDERASAKELESTTEEVIQSYYPEGLSNTLVSEASGKELRTPQDVVDESGGTMTIEEAAQWLTNKQFELNKSVTEIKDNARKIAETTVSFKNDGVEVLQRYKPLFEGLKDKYPNLQQNVFQALLSQTKVDKEKGVILSSPDVVAFYDTYLTPYKDTFEAATNQPATAPTPPAAEPPKPTADDRLDVSGDGGAGKVDDPNDFAQQVVKELSTQN